VSASFTPGSTPRIRCNYCGRRILASSILCPNCQRNPRAFYWKSWHIPIVLVVLALILGGAAFYLAPDLSQLLPASIALNPTPTRTNTRPPVTVVLVATRPPATATPVPPTPTHTATRVPTRVPTATAAPSETRTPAPAEPVPTETASPVPTIIVVPPPQLVAPANGDAVHGANKSVQLDFQPAQPLRAQEWYLVEVNFIAREGYAARWCEFTRLDLLEFPKAYYEDSSASVRSFSWRVSVVRSSQISPSTCDAPYELLSDPSDLWTFYWY
jgi:hypothetical protein